MEPPHQPLRWRDPRTGNTRSLMSTLLQGRVVLVVKKDCEPCRVQLRRLQDCERKDRVDVVALDASPDGRPAGEVLDRHLWTRDIRGTPTVFHSRGSTLGLWQCEHLTAWLAPGPGQTTSAPREAK